MPPILSTHAKRSTINIPFPTPRLAQIALRALSVDAELSPLVKRSFSLARPPSSETNATIEDPAASMNVSPKTGGALHVHPAAGSGPAPSSREVAEPVLVTTYSATTNRMLRVSVNGFFESLGVVLGCMRELDDEESWKSGWIGEEGTGEGSDVAELRRVQGLQESGTIGVA